MWIIVDRHSKEPVGWPKTLTFKTKKEARIRMQKILHQMKSFWELELKEVENQKVLTAIK
jgi:hypothetical protein